jgi:hypothetical protein
VDEPTIHCKLELLGLSIEASGPKKFVEEMFRRVTQDLGGNTEPNPRRNTSKHVWVYLRGTHCHKVYLSDVRTLERHPLGRFVDPDRIRRFYTGSEDAAAFAGFVSHDETLWAEFTDEGRALLREQLNGQD